MLEYCFKLLISNICQIILKTIIIPEQFSFSRMVIVEGKIISFPEAQISL